LSPPPSGGWENLPMTTEEGVGEPKSHFGSFGEDKNMLPLLRIE
jgi:hypothetical protein